MLPIKHSSIFKSRWMALLWAAGVIWFALDVASPPDKPGKPDAANDAALNAAVATLPADQREALNTLASFGK